MKLTQTFCTTSTRSHLYKCFALAESIAKYKGELIVLLTDAKSYEEDPPENVQVIFLDDVNSSLANQIKIKYKSSPDKLRWSLKPVLIIHLLAKHNKVIYLDNDLFFFNDFNFLFDHLEISPLLLTPHHYPRDPKKELNWFEANFRVGLYNAGFIGANTDAISTLEWWAKACLYRCEKNYWRGLFDDQKYLDLFPIIDPSTKTLQHLGCNVAAWNKDICALDEHSEMLLINETFPLIFYHFNAYSFTHLAKDSKILKRYFTSLKKYKHHLKLEDLIPREKYIEKLKLAVWKVLNQWNA